MAIPASNPTLSVVIPSRVRVDLLRQCLASVVQHAPNGTEIVVVDDGSTAEIVSATAQRFAGVRVIRLARPGGFCKAANAGIAAASGVVVELLNDDTVVTPDWAGAVSLFSNPAVGAVAPLILRLDPDRVERGLPPLIDSAGDEYDPGGFARKRWSGLPTATAAGRAGSVWGASGAAAFYRREAVMQAGGFPEHFGGYFEDVDLSFRLRRLGYEILFESSSVVWHRISASYGRSPGRRLLEQQSCNEERVFWRNLRGPALWSAVPRHAAVLAGKAARRVQEGLFMPWLMGRVRALAGG